MTYQELIQQFMGSRVTERFSSYEVDVYLFILHCAQEIKTNPIPLPIKFVCDTLQISKPTFLKTVISLQEKKLIVKLPSENYTFYRIVGMKESYSGSRSTTFTTRLIRFTRESIRFTPKTDFLAENEPKIDKSETDNDFKGLTDADDPRAHTPPRKSGIVKDYIQDIQKTKLTPKNDREDSILFGTPCQSNENQSIAIISDAEYTIIENEDVLDSAPQGGAEEKTQVVRTTVRTAKARASHTNPKKDSPPVGAPPPPSERGIAFARWFLTLIPDRYKKQIYDEDEWSRTFDRLRSIDGYEELEIARICRWARANKIWSTNFYSPLKLRKKQPGSKLTYYQVFLEQSQKGNDAQQPTIADAAARRQARLAKYAADEESEDREDH